MNACAGLKRSHLQQVGESYTEHGKVALSIAWRAFKITLALIIHAMFPDKLPTYGSNHIIELYWFVIQRKKK